MRYRAGASNAAITSVQIRKATLAVIRRYSAFAFILVELNSQIEEVIVPLPASGMQYDGDAEDDSAGNKCEGARRGPSRRKLMVGGQEQAERYD
jgi:hypothetical protein